MTSPLQIPVKDDLLTRLFILVSPTTFKISPLAIALKCVAYHILFIITVCCAVLLVYTIKTPSPPKGWGPHEYEGGMGTRKSLKTYLSDKNLKDSDVTMVKFSVATANFGGIFTENKGFLNPWIGSVSADAARLQVEAGARAMVLDVWPDPADTSRAVVASMLDMRTTRVLNTWRNSWGLNAGLSGSFSNWQRVSRNVVAVGDILTATIGAAFKSSGGQQNEDPFFLILNLHGPMTVEYLNRLGGTIRQAVGSYAMPSQWGHAANQKMLGAAPVSDFMGQAVVIVNPDFASKSVSGSKHITAPNSTQFIRQVLATAIGEVTNVIQMTPGSIMFEPGNTSSLTAATQPNFVTGGDAITPPEAGFCVIQPSIGSISTDNNALFVHESFIDCVNTKAQFVAVNLFSPNSNDKELADFFNPSYFGTYSFAL